MTETRLTARIATMEHDAVERTIESREVSRVERASAWMPPPESEPTSVDEQSQLQRAEAWNRRCRRKQGNQVRPA